MRTATTRKAQADKTDNGAARAQRPIAHTHKERDSKEHDVQVSPRTAKSRQMRWNSDDGIFTVQAYVWSGTVKCSLSMSMSFMSNSDTRSWPEDSNMKVMRSEPSSVLNVTTSSLPAHLRILDREPRFKPRDTERSQRNLSKPSAFSFRETRETWDESMACNAQQARGERAFDLARTFERVDWRGKCSAASAPATQTARRGGNTTDSSREGAVDATGAHKNRENHA